LLHRLQTDQSLARYAGWFVPLKIETKGEEWSKWCSKYKHEGSSIPIVFVVRADGQQLFGKSGSLPEAQLHQMIMYVLRQAGTVYSDQQLGLITTSLGRSKQAVESDDLQGAVRELGKISQLGTLGSLGSYAEIAQEADSFAQELIERGRSALAAAKEKLSQEETRLDGALGLMEVRRVYLPLTPLKEEILAVFNETRTKEDLRDTMKQAEQLDLARDLLSKPAGSRRALTALRRVVEQYPGTPAASLATAWLREHFPEEASGLPGGDVATAGTEQMRAWTSNDGYKVQAVLIGYGYTDTTKAPYVVLKTREGKQVQVPFARLSEQSQQLAKELVRKLQAKEGKAP
jgi:hypothetical protein